MNIRLLLRFIYDWVSRAFAFNRWLSGLSLGALLSLTVTASAAGAGQIPTIKTENGRHALIVDGEPFLILGAQCHNSSAWPATMPAVWRELEYLNANTLEAPIYWEQFEPAPGKFDTSLIDRLIDEARTRHLRLILLWFGTWKNGSGHYQPLWMKAQPERFPRMINADGKRVDSPSPHSREMLEADVAAFRALMHHLKEKDGEHTVILVQVQNEPGTWGGTVRDHSPEAERLFAAPVPKELSAKLGAVSGKDWRETFGKDADEYFHAWSIAQYIGQVAAAGKAEYPLPLYVNAALRDPLKPGPASTYESGGPTDNVLDIYKVAAPAIDILAPDIYQSEPEKYLKVLDLYSRPDNPLLVPETIGFSPFARHLFDALGHGAIGWAPFGVDSPQKSESEWRTAVQSADYSHALVARNYKLTGSAMRLIARLNFEGKLRAVGERPGQTQDSLVLQNWTAKISYGIPAFGHGKEPKGNPQPTGGVLIAEIAPNEFLVGGFSCRVDFVSRESTTAQRDFLRVEEVQVKDRTLQPVRIWNGDETDYGLNFSETPTWLHVTLGTY